MVHKACIAGIWSKLEAPPRFSQLLTRRARWRAAVHARIGRLLRAGVQSEPARGQSLRHRHVHRKPVHPGCSTARRCALRRIGARRVPSSVQDLLEGGLASQDERHFDRNGIHMKVVLFCGGLGTRIRDYGDNIPKPMIPIGDKPILWHLMNFYSEHGHKDFVLCLGYKANTIKEFFLNGRQEMYSDCVVTQGGTEVKLLGKPRQDWRITMI